MRMTKKGAIPAPKEEVWIGKCKHCRSEYEANSEELMQEGDNSFSFTKPARFATCELCQRIVYFKKLVMRE